MVLPKRLNEWLVSGHDSTSAESSDELGSGVSENYLPGHQLALLELESVERSWARSMPE